MVTVFVLKLLSGITLMWLLMPRKDVTDGFFRIQMLVVLGLAVLAALTIEPSIFFGQGSASPDELRRAAAACGTLKWFLVSAAIVSYLGHIFWKLGRRTPGLAAICLLAALCCGTLILRDCWLSTATPILLQLASDTASSAVLGATLTGMLLGHWYLTTPTMSIQPLTWFARTLFVSGCLRCAVSCVALTQSGWPPDDLTHSLWLSVRLAGGILVPVAGAVMVLRILKYRNTQSATGVLFAALILVFMGEMSAALLERELGRVF